MTPTPPHCVFTHRAIRDLAWALFNPPLFDQLPKVPPQWLSPVWQDQQTLAWLAQLDRAPEALFEHLKDQRATRLGVYFEQLLSFYFEHFPRFRLLAKNLQANDTKRTIGEYDFIVWDQQEQCHYHIEVAVKFYIGLESLECHIARNHPIYNWHLWVGPNKKDTLGIKMTHLLERQLRLSHTDAGQQALASIGLHPEQLSPKLLLTGRLYYPYENPQHTKVEAPHHSHHSLERQRWFTLGNVATDPLNHYVILPRQLWMSPLNQYDIAESALPPIKAQDLRQSLKVAMQQHAAPLHIAAINPITGDELERFFVVEA